MLYFLFVGTMWDFDSNGMVRRLTLQGLKALLVHCQSFFGRTKIKSLGFP